MPSFTGSGAELRRLAKQWREGNKVFRDLFEVLPKLPDAVYNPIRRRATADALNQYVLQECDDAWTAAEVRKRTRDAAKAVSAQRKELAQTGLSRAQLNREMRPLRASLRQRRAVVQQEIQEKGGILAGILDAQRSVDAQRHKGFLILCFGDYMLDLREEQ